MAVPEGQAEKHEEALRKKDEGNLAFKEKRYNKAAQLYTESLVLERNHLVFGNRAQSFIHLAQYELALRDINEALEMEPTFLKNINRRAKVLGYLGMYSEALADTAAILKLSPKDKAAKADADAWTGKENVRSVEVKQWNGGEEFIEDEMVSIPIEGLEQYDEPSDAPPATVPPAVTVSAEENEVDSVVPLEDTVPIEEKEATTVPPTDTVATEEKKEVVVPLESTVPTEEEEDATVPPADTVSTESKEDVVTPREDTVADDSDKDTTYSSDKDTSSKDTLSDESLTSSEDDTVAVEETAPEDTVEGATVTAKATVADKEVTVAAEEPARPLSSEEEITVTTGDLDTISEDEEYDYSSKYSEEEEDTVPKGTVAVATVTSKDTEAEVSPATPTAAESPAAAVSPSSDETFLSAPERSTSNASWEDVKNASMTSSISDLHSMGNDSDGYTTSPMTPNDTVDDEAEKGAEGAVVVESGPATVPEEVTVVKKREQQKEEEVPIVVLDSAATVFAKTDEVKEKEEKGKGDGQVPIVTDTAATVPKEVTVERKNEEDTVTKKEKKKRDTVVDPPAPTVIPAPATNFLQFDEHFRALKHDSLAFGKYFLTINPGIIAMLLDIDHIRAVVDGLTAVAGEEVADLSAIASSLLMLCHVQRFDIIVMFMNAEDKAKAYSLIDLLPPTQEKALIRANFE